MREPRLRRLALLHDRAAVERQAPRRNTQPLGVLVAARHLVAKHQRRRAAATRVRRVGGGVAQGAHQQADRRDPAHRHRHVPGHRDLDLVVRLEEAVLARRRAVAERHRDDRRLVVGGERHRAAHRGRNAD